MVGCLVGKKGNYVLITKKQFLVVRLASAKDLKAQVGHKVKVTGTFNDASAPANNATSAVNAHDKKKTDDVSTGGQSSANHRQFRVERMKMLSAKCDMKSGKNSERSWTHILND
jgi:hypothetical protein